MQNSHQIHEALREAGYPIAEDKDNKPIEISTRITDNLLFEQVQDENGEMLLALS